MSPGEVFQISQEALWVMLKLGLPLMLLALVVGVTIAFIQALTQIQEMTLSFIPKMVSMVAALFWLLPYFGQTMSSFTRLIFDKIVSAG